MKYAYTIIYVENVKETVDFYIRAFGFNQKFVTPENDYAELLSGETTIAFASNKLGVSNFKSGFQKSNKTEKPFGVEMVFVTKHIDAAFKKAIDAGAIEFESVEEKPWGQKVGYVRDNNGFLIEICTPIKSE